MPQLTSHWTYIWHMSLNKYGCYIINITHTAIMLNGHIDPTFLPISTKIQPCCTHNQLQQLFHTLLANMLPKQIWISNATYCHICKLVHMTWDSYVTIYHRYELQSTMQPGALVHTFHIIGISPYANMPATSHMYVPLHS